MAKRSKVLKGDEDIKYFLELDDASGSSDSDRSKSESEFSDSDVDESSSSSESDEGDVLPHKIPVSLRNNVPGPNVSQRNYSNDNPVPFNAGGSEMPSNNSNMSAGEDSTQDGPDEGDSDEMPSSLVPDSLFSSQTAVLTRASARICGNFRGNFHGFAHNYANVLPGNVSAVCDAGQSRGRPRGRPRGRARGGQATVSTRGGRGANTCGRVRTCGDRGRAAHVPVINVPSSPATNSPGIAANVQIPTATAPDANTSLGMDWIPDDNSKPKRFKFSGNERVNYSHQPTSSVEYFSQLFDKTLLKKIVEWTNARAEAKKIENPNSYTAKKWRNLTEEEFRTFLALCMLMGHIKIPEIHLYWSTSELYHHPIFGKSMSRNRFTAILSYMCFYSANEPVTSRLHKVCNVINPIIENIQKVYEPGKNLSLDESMLLWRGRLVFRQYLKNKRHKYGIKFYELCTPNGFILSLLLYTGKGTTSGKEGHAFSVTKKLMRPYFGKGRTLFVDNYYTSIPLMRFLYRKGTAMVGTLRKNRKGIPDFVKTTPLSKGESVFARSKNYLILKWKDKRDVMMISSRHNADFAEVKNRLGKTKIKPEVVREYNENMSGVDRSDQMLSYYSSPRKTLRWYIKVFFHLLDICAWNGHFLRNKDTPNACTYLTFREDIIRDWLKVDGATSRVSRSSSTNQAPSTSSIPQGHFSTQYESNKRARCRVCYEGGIQKLTKFYCSKCRDSQNRKIGLCISCFLKYDHK